MRRLLAFAAFVFLSATGAVADPPTALDRQLYIVQGYDAARDPAADLRLAIARAQQNDVRILLVVGGDWCAWCDILDLYIARTARVRDAFGQSFVILKVNISRENQNEPFLARFPQSVGYPDFFILESDGAYLGQQDTGALERGSGYDEGRMIAFARSWRR
ncbi:MAG: thioredoxin family protein [Hyphomonadaceae bacterium]|nr:thioredoxin family protein [Hyphomonadaceae bacterium]